MQKKLFWLVCRAALFVYARLPIFGALRASMAVIKQHGKYLVIERNDGRGLSFPGGLALWGEDAEKALRREVSEETGLTATRLRFTMRYESRDDIPVVVSAFEVEAEGVLRGSWEGSPCWKSVEELRKRVISSQQKIVQLLD